MFYLPLKSTTALLVTYFVRGQQYNTCCTPMSGMVWVPGDMVSGREEPDDSTAGPALG